jgi:hypothetical protein
VKLDDAQRAPGTIAYHIGTASFAIALLAVCALFNNLANLASILAGGLPEHAVDEVMRHERRLEQARALLPPEGVIGYLTDLSGDAATKRYYLAQYALAPVIVVRGPGQRLTLVDFSSPEAIEALPTGNLTIHTDFGDGLMLIVSPDRP